MATKRGRTRSRLEIADEIQAAEKLGVTAAKEGKAKAKTAKKATTKKRESSRKKAEPQRMRMVWGVFDNSNQQVASYPYPEKESAEKRATELTEKGRGPYFVQPVKEAMPAAAAE